MTRRLRPRRYAISSFRHKSPEGRDAAMIAHAAAHGDDTALMALADRLEGHDHPAAEIVRRAHAGEGVEGDFDQQGTLGLMHAVRDPRRDYTTPSTYPVLNDHPLPPGEAAVGLRYFNLPTGHYWHLYLGTNGGDGDPVWRSWLVPTTPEEVAHYGAALGGGDGAGLVDAARTPPPDTISPFDGGADYYAARAARAGLPTAPDVTPGMVHAHLPPDDEEPDVGGHELPVHMTRRVGVRRYSLTTENDFHQILDQNPDDHHTRGVLADYLQEQGDERAEGYRALGALQRRPHNPDYSPHHWHWYTREHNPHVTGDEPWYLPDDWGRALGVHPMNTSRREADDRAARAFATLPPERRAELMGGGEPHALSRRRPRRMGRAPADEVAGIASQQGTPAEGMNPHNHSLADHGDPLETVVRRDLSYRNGGGSSFYRNLYSHADELAAAGSPVSLHRGAWTTHRLPHGAGVVEVSPFGDDGNGNGLSYEACWRVPRPDGLESSYAAALAPHEVIHLLNEHGVPHDLREPWGGGSHDDDPPGPTPTGDPEEDRQARADRHRKRRQGQVRRYSREPRPESGKLTPEQMSIVSSAFAPHDPTAWGVLGDHLADNGFPGAGGVLSRVSEGHPMSRRDDPVRQGGGTNPGEFRYYTHRDRGDPPALVHTLRLEGPNGLVHLFRFREQENDPTPPPVGPDDINRDAPEYRRPSPLSRRGSVRRYQLTTEDDFHRLLDQNPDDHQTRGVFADWLEERGDPRAEGYRALGALGRTPGTPSADLAWWTSNRSYPPSSWHNTLPHDWLTRIPERAEPVTSHRSPWNENNRRHGSRREAEDQAAHAFAGLPEGRRAELMSGSWGTGKKWGRGQVTPPEQMGRRGAPRRYSLTDHPSFQAGLTAANHTETGDGGLEAEHTPHLAYSDFLEESGMPAHADWVRRAVAEHRRRGRGYSPTGGGTWNATYPSAVGDDFHVYAGGEDRDGLRTMDVVGSHADEHGRRPVWSARLPREEFRATHDRLVAEGARSHVAPDDEPIHHTRRTTPRRYSADHGGVRSMLATISPRAWRGWRHTESNPYFDMTPRVVAADYLQDLGRDHEAALLRDTTRHVYPEHDDTIHDAGEISHERHYYANRAGHGAAANLPSDERQYLRTALWSSTDDEGRPLDEDHDEHAIHPDTMGAMLADYRTFKNTSPYNVGNNEADGHHFWLSRNGHGTGFFDAEDRSPDQRDELQNRAEAHGEYDLSVGDDGSIHGSHEAPPVPPHGEEPTHHTRRVSSKVRYGAYRAPTGGMVSRGTHQPGGQFVPDMQGEFMKAVGKVAPQQQVTPTTPPARRPTDPTPQKPDVTTGRRRRRRRAAEKDTKLPTISS